MAVAEAGAHAMSTETDLLDQGSNRLRARNIWDSPRYTHLPVPKPAKHDTFWQAEASESVASARLCDQALGALALKYGLGTKYDPFIPGALVSGGQQKAVDGTHQW